MIVRLLTVNNDMVFGVGKSAYISGPVAIGQNVKTAIQSWIGDVFWQTNFGVDWKNRLAPNQQDNLEQEISQIILGLWGVTGINSIAMNFNGVNRVESISVDISTIYDASQIVSVSMPVPS